MDTLLQAFSEAIPVWEQAILGMFWYHGLGFAAYLGTAWLCLLNGHIAEQSGEGHAMWYAAAALLCLLAANTVLHGDLLLLQVLRAVAKLEGWYGERRQVQYLVIAALAATAWFAAGWYRTRLRAADDASGPVAWGLAGLLMILALRAVSAHGVDQVLDLRLAGISVGRLLEFSCLGWVAHGALRRLSVR